MNDDEAVHFKRLYYLPWSFHGLRELITVMEKYCFTHLQYPLVAQPFLLEYMLAVAPAAPPTSTVIHSQVPGF